MNLCVHYGCMYECSYVCIYICTLVVLLLLIIAAILVIDKLGRIKTGSISLCLTTLCLCVKLVFMDSDPIIGSIALAIGRASMMACFCLLYIYTPELYPTCIRASAMGLAGKSVFNRKECIFDDVV